MTRLIPVIAFGLVLVLACYSLGATRNGTIRYGETVYREIHAPAGRPSLRERQRAAIMQVWNLSEEYVRHPSNIYGEK